MARPPRVLYRGAIYHVMARANGHRRLFVDDLDRLRFFELLGEAQQRYAVRWRAFTLMTSHYHAGVETPARLTAAESDQYLDTIVVGSQDFQEDVRKQIGITMHDLIIPRSYRALARPSLGQLFAGCTADLEVRNRTIRRAQVVYGYRQAEVARSLNLHPNTVSKIVSKLKKQRFFLVKAN